MTEELSPRVRERMLAELRARAEAAVGSPGSGTGSGSGIRDRGTAQGQPVPTNTRRADPVRDQEPPTKWTRCARCRADVEVVTANDHKDQGRCPRCRRLL